MQDAPRFYSALHTEELTRGYLDWGTKAVCSGAGWEQTWELGMLVLAGVLTAPAISLPWETMGARL